MNVNINILRETVARLIQLNCRLNDVIAQLEDGRNGLIASGNQYDDILRSLYHQRQALEDRMSTLHALAHALDDAADQYQDCEQHLIGTAQSLPVSGDPVIGHGRPAPHRTSDFLNNILLAPHRLPLENHLPLPQRRLYPFAGTIIPPADVREAMKTICPVSAD